MTGGAGSGDATTPCWCQAGDEVPGWDRSGLGPRDEPGDEPGDGLVVHVVGLGSAVVVGEPVPGTVREGGEPGIVRRPIVGGVVFDVEGAELGIGYEVAFFGDPHGSALG